MSRHGSYFIAGTDTGVGKTTIAAGLLVAARRRGWRTTALKPVASGAETTAGGLRNSDALALQAAQGGGLDYSLINPIVMEQAIAPHLALEESGRSLDIAGLLPLCAPALALAHDFGVVEGAGGWRVPLNGEETLADLARALGLPVILVVGLRLGCINHALLSAEAIRADGLRLAGWVANQVDPAMERLEANIATLDARLHAPRLGFVPWLAGQDAEQVADRLELDALLCDTDQGGSAI